MKRLLLTMLIMSAMAANAMAPTPTAVKLAVK